MAAAARVLVTGEGLVVADHVEEARSMLRRGLGLMFRRSLPAGHGLWIQPCSSIHMFFMRFAIDVAFVDGTGRVIRVYHAIKPWRISRIVFGARAAVELPAGTLAAASVDSGTVLRLT